MKNYLKKEKYIKPFIVGMCLLLTGCGSIGLAQEATFESAYENKPEEEQVNIYTSEGCGVVQEIDTGAGLVTIYLLERNEEVTFVYDGATAIQDKYGSALTISQVMPGEVVDICYNSELRKLGSMMLTPESWSYNGSAKYQIDERKGTVSIGSDAYSLGKNVKVFSGERQITTDQILKQDVLSFRGMGHEIVSIVVEKGHGYLDLTGEEALVGGWIEVGQTVISQITQDMLITVPEGNYVVRLTAGNIEESREISIERDKETVLDFSDIEIPKPTNGRVTFEIVPEDASVYIDDSQVEVDTSYAVKLPLGIHKITASAEGYDTFSEYFEVKEENTVVRMNLSEAKETTVSGNETDTEATITIEGPVGVEVYMDNLYKGIAPVTYQKEAGDHVITLRKTGYVTRSHSISIEDDGKDVIYSFPELEADATTVSGNTVSGNEEDTDKTVSENKTSVSDNEADDETDDEDDDETDKAEHVITISENILSFS